MSEPLLQEVFDPMKDKDLGEIAIKIRTNDAFSSSSDLGILTAITDAQAADEKVFVIHFDLKSKPIRAEFTEFLGE